MSCSPNTGTVPPYSSSPNPYPAAVYPVRSTYPQQSPYAQVSVLLKGCRFWLLVLVCYPNLPEDGAIISGPHVNSTLSPWRFLLFILSLLLIQLNWIKSLLVDVFSLKLFFFCDPGINTFTTTRHLLHTASVCGTASCYPSHNCGPTKWDACRHVRPTHPSSPPQWCCHGDGSRHHHGHVRWWEFVSISACIVFYRNAKFEVLPWWYWAINSFFLPQTIVF